MIPISLFLKFGHKKHLEELRRGVLYMNSLGYFQKLESDEAKRSDSNEGLRGVYQQDKIKVIITVNGQDHELTDMAAPVLITSSALSDIHAFCLFALTPGEYEVEDEVYDGNKLKIRFDSAHEKFGGHVLFTTNASEFQARIRAALEKAQRYARLGLVQYVDETTFHGSIPEDKIGFYKLDTFKTQREYRILVFNSNKPNEPISIEVGDLSDITEIVSWSDLDVKLMKNS